MRKFNLFIKRLIDLFCSLVGIVILSPLFIIILLLIKLSSKGPVLFKQERLGKDGQVFKVLKFRTMIVGAEKIGDGLSIKSEDDPRITRIGKILRATSLDELPQLINVILGEMSLIGPRPPVVYFPYDGYLNYPEWAKHRFSMKPGITGLSQVRDRNNTTWEKRIKTDIEYVNNFNIIEDIKIFIFTFVRVIKISDIYRA